MVIGGSQSLKTVEVVSLNTMLPPSCMRNLAQLPSPTQGAAAAPIECKIFSSRLQRSMPFIPTAAGVLVCAGRGPKWEPLIRCLTYSSRTKSWRPAPAATIPHATTNDVTGKQTKN